MRQGDILLVDYKYDPIGWIIKWISKSKYHHVAWALNEWTLIESIGKGVQTISLREYLDKRWYNIKLIRFKDLSKEQIKQVTKILVAQQHNAYYWKFFISYFLVAFGLKPLCKNCSYFVLTALWEINYYIFKRNRKFIVPEDFNKHPKVIDVSDELPKGY